MTGKMVPRCCPWRGRSKKPCEQPDRAGGREFCPVSNVGWAGLRCERHRRIGSKPAGITLRPTPKPPTLRAGVGWTAAAMLLLAGVWGRKVRAPQGRVPGNAWAARADGKCNREQTAERPARVRGKGETVRYERTTSLATDRYGKPHPEQDQIGVHLRGPRRTRVGCLSPLATVGLEEWPFSTEPGLQADSNVCRA